MVAGGKITRPARRREKVCYPRLAGLEGGGG